MLCDADAENPKRPVNARKKSKKGAQWYESLDIADVMVQFRQGLTVVVQSMKTLRKSERMDGPNRKAEKCKLGGWLMTSGADGMSSLVHHV